MVERSRVDAELVRRGLARSRRQAVDFLAAGRVTVAGRAVTKPSALVDEQSEIAVAVDDGVADYASRAGRKLVGALDALDGRICLDSAYCADLGASTGGFTDVLLLRGVRHVAAVDVGHGQLLRRLRDDARVTSIEGKNVRDLVPDDLAHAPDLITGDLSFISLTLVLPALAQVLRPGGSALLLVKPQFEVGRELLGKGGVVRDPALHARAVTAVVRGGEDAGLRWRGVVPSPLPGPSGNREFFTWFTAADSMSDASVSDGGAGAARQELARAVADAVVPGSVVRLYDGGRDSDCVQQHSDGGQDTDCVQHDSNGGQDSDSSRHSDSRRHSDDSEDGNVA